MKNILLHPTEFDISIFKELVDGSNIKYYAKNSLILETGDSINSFFFIVEGLIQVFFGDIRGNEITLLLLRNNNFFGEETLFSDTEQESLFSLKTNRDCKLIEIPKSKIKKYSQQHPELYEVYMKSMNSKIRCISGQFYNIAFNNSIEKIANILCKMTICPNHENSDNTIKLPYSPTHQQLSSLINCSRSTTTSLLNELKKDEIIDFNKDKLIIQDINKLKSISNLY